MIRATTCPILAILALGAAADLSAQIAVSRVRAAYFTETYAFEEAVAFSDSLPFRRVNEMSVPIGVDLRLGRFADLTISGGWVKVRGRSKERARLADQEITGLRDTELRLGLNVVPGRLILLVTGVLPTGETSVEQTAIRVLDVNALASDLLGFAAPTVGSGGSVGGGFAGAVPAGPFALGLGATYRQPLSYEPILGQPTTFKPGREVRLRAGLEGPLARMTYLRVAGVFATRGEDELGTERQSGVGNRFVGYVAVNQQAGPVAVTVYGFDVYRTSPELEGQAVLPRGNLFAVGSRIGIPVTPRTVLTPRAEFRLSAQDEDTLLRKRGTSLRFGFDLRQQLTPALAGTLQLGRITGDVFDVSLSGTRAAVHVEITP